MVLCTLRFNEGAPVTLKPAHPNRDYPLGRGFLLTMTCTNQRQKPGRNVIFLFEPRFL